MKIALHSEARKCAVFSRFKGAELTFTGCFLLCVKAPPLTNAGNASLARVTADFLTVKMPDFAFYKFCLYFLCAIIDDIYIIFLTHSGKTYLKNKNAPLILALKIYIPKS